MPWVAAAALLAWILLHVIHADTLLYHDSWRYHFPVTVNVARDIECTGLPHWLPTPDTGAPHLIHAISFSTTHLLRIPALFISSCLRLTIAQALYLYKLQIFLSHLVFALGIFVLGRLLFCAPATAQYLLVATLFAGLSLEASHSDQVINLIFWMPWIAICMVLYYRHRASRAGAWSLNGMALFASIQALDMYPHPLVLALLVAAGLYAAMLQRSAFEPLFPRARYLGPAALFLAVAAFQLFSLLTSAAAYRPSFRQELAVDPAQIHESFFVQPTALVGSLLPLGMLAAHDLLAPGLEAWLEAHLHFSGVQMFMYRYNALLLHPGVVPLFMFTAALASKHLRRARLAWALFTLFLFLPALQQTSLYLLLHRLPFFHLFRAYGHFAEVAVFGFLVTSGYGFDALMNSQRTDREALARRALGIVLALAVCAGIAFLLLTRTAPQALVTARNGLFVDVASLLAVPCGVYAACRGTVSLRRTLATTVMLIVIPQTVYAVGVYRTLGHSAAVVMADYRMEPGDRIAKQRQAVDPEHYVRKRCANFPHCYLSPDPVVRLERGQDYEGPFWRSRNSTTYHADASPAVAAALAGKTHPVYWASREARSYTSSAEIVRSLNAAEPAVGASLRQVTFVRADDRLAGATFPDSKPQLLRLETGQDAIRITSRSTAPFLLNASVTYDKSWAAYVDGQRTPISRGNLDGLVLRVPAGEHLVELRYESWQSRWFFRSRYFLLAIAVVAMGWLTLSACRGTLQPSQRGGACQ